MPLPPTDLTGHAQFRRSWTGKLILQVERRTCRDPAVRGAATTTWWEDADELELPTLRLVREARKLGSLL